LYYNFLLEKWCKSLDIFLITNNIFYQHDIIYPNESDCNYTNKVKRIKELYNLNNYTKILAFGDSDGDLEMLKIADEKYYNYFK
jgi:phosphoserine phosphatase